MSIMRSSSRIRDIKSNQFTDDSETPSATKNSYSTCAQELTMTSSSPEYYSTGTSNSNSVQMPMPILDPAFEIHQSGSWTCFNCNTQFPYDESIGRHMFTCLNLKSYKLVANTGISVRFNYSSNLGQHLRNVHEPSSSNTSRCGILKETSTKLDADKLKKSLAPGIFPSYSKCKLCSKIVSNLRSHLARIHGQKSYTCHLCPAKFSYSNSLKLHLNSHSDLKPFACETCDFKCNHPSNLRRHILSLHGRNIAITPSYSVMSANALLTQELPQQKIVKKLPSVTYNTGSSAKKFECTICKAKFKYRHHLKYHEVVHTNQKPFSCTICGKRFKFPSSVLRHKKSFHGMGMRAEQQKITEIKVNPNSMAMTKLKEMSRDQDSYTYTIPCSFCSKNFKRKDHLHIHQRIHTGYKPYTCNHCGRRFTQESSLSRHLRCKKPCYDQDSISSRLKKNKKSVAIKRKISDFVSKSGATKSGSTGSEFGSIPYKYFTTKSGSTASNFDSIASKSDALESGLTVSKSGALKSGSTATASTSGVTKSGSIASKSGATKSGSISFKSGATESGSTASKSDSTKPLNSLHCSTAAGAVELKKNHTEVKSNSSTCHVCSKTFYSFHTLSRHMMIHTGEKPFKCTECDAKFNQKNSLVFHQYTHSKIKNFQCNICKVKFTMPTTLRQHIKRHTVALTGETNSVKCTKCSTVFRSSRALVHHMKVHRDR